MRVTGTETLYKPEAASMRPVFALLFAGVGLLLLLTCTNVGDFTSSPAHRHGGARSDHQAGTRRQPWPGRESASWADGRTVLSVAATAICLWASSLIARFAMTRLQPSLASVLDFSVDARMVAVAAGLAIATCLMSSLAPALSSTRHLVAGRPSPRRGVSTRAFFLGAQVAGSVVLLVAAVLLGRGLEQAASQELGFTLDTLMALRVERAAQTPDADRAFMREVIAAVESPSVAVSASLPLDDGGFYTGVRRVDEPEEADRQAGFQPVSSSYFDVLGISRSVPDGRSVKAPSRRW